MTLMQSKALLAAFATGAATVALLSILVGPAPSGLGGLEPSGVPGRAQGPAAKNAAPEPQDRRPLQATVGGEADTQPPAGWSSVAEAGTESAGESFELFVDWPLHERDLLLRRRLQLVTQDRYEAKFAAGQYEVVEARYLKQLVEDDSGRPRPTSLRYQGDEQQLVVLSEEECPEAWAIMAALKENRAAIREYEEQLQRVADSVGRTR